VIGRIPRRVGFARFAGSRATRDQGLSVRLTLDDAAGGVRVAFSTPKRIGTAVVRNRARRQLRELMRERADRLPSGWYLLGVEQAPVDKNWGQLGITLDRVLSHALTTSHQRGTTSTTNHRRSL